MSPAESHTWRVRRGVTFDTSRRTVVMGILNVTPDSFSDGGRLADVDQAVAAAEALLQDGADIVDVGGESSRPGRAETLSDEEERQRVVPVVAAIRQRFPQAVISVDTYREATLAAALDAGADILNDIYALRRSPAMAKLVAESGAGVVLMHMQGDPLTMQDNPRYENVLVDIRNFLRTQMDVALAAGVPEAAIAVDPGIGFGKTVDHNAEILAGLEYLRLLQRPIMIGASRKGFLGHLTGGLPVDQREEATVAAHVCAVLHGAGIVRTHNVRAARRSLAVVDALREHM